MLADTYSKRVDVLWSWSCREAKMPDVGVPVGELENVGVSCWSCLCDVSVRSGKRL